MKIRNLLIYLCSSIVILYLLPLNLLSDDLGKANRYYEKNNYKFALEIYLQLYDQKPKLSIAQKIADCYRYTNELEEAEKAYANVFTFSGFDPINYIYYADILKQNGKFELAKVNYLKYAERRPSQSDEAVRLANSCDAARLWLAHPDQNIKVTNETDFNSEFSDFSPIAYKKGFIFVSDRRFLKPIKRIKSKKIYRWTGNPFLKLYQAINANDTLDGSLKLSIMKVGVNGKAHVGPASLSSDEKIIYFTKSGYDADLYDYNQPVNVYKKTIYMAAKNGNSWLEPIPFIYNNPKQYSVQHPALSPDGKYLYFSSDMPGTLGGMDIFYCERTKLGWAKPINCGAVINTKQNEVFPYVRKDGKLYFSSNGHLGLGGLDIFSAIGSENNWSATENLKAPMNSSKDDFGIFYYSDNLTGFLSSNRNGGQGSDDIYRFVERPKAIFYALEGMMIDKQSGHPLSGLSVFLIDKNTGEQVSTVSNEDGVFGFDLKKDTEYQIKGDDSKYISKQIGEVSTKNVKASTIFNVMFEVEKGEEAYIVRLNNIYYDFDKYNIRKDAEPDLMKVLDFMKSTINVRIEMRSHTDARGSAAYNLKLSQQRALSAENYLLDKGADKKRLSAKGFGETVLLNKCKDGVKCTKQEHQLNRRTEFKVVRIDSLKQP
jgi:outer membrane protein OmpA-like peptidoglycan-associated protein